ncbi:MAG: hypothetical protein ACE5QV_00305, partial [Fidelibacterota bacterium]
MVKIKFNSSKTKIILLLVFIFVAVIYLYNFNNGILSDLDTIELETKKLLAEVDNLKDGLKEVETELTNVSTQRLRKIIATAYNSTTGQTDDEPFITASGEPVGDGTLALSRDLIRAENELMLKMGYNPRGTISFGDTVHIVYLKPFIVRDTMNRRFRNRADIWTSDYRLAK